MARDEIVSNASEQLILVDDQDREIGFKPKTDCHMGKGVLHRAFSIFVFNSDNELLLQQRALSKMLWPGFWSNTCCSHPRRGEVLGVAVARRLAQELGFTCPLVYLYKFKYHAQFGAVGAEQRQRPSPRLCADASNRCSTSSRARASWSGCVVAAAARCRC